MSEGLVGWRAGGWRWGGGMWWSGLAGWRAAGGGGLWVAAVRAAPSAAATTAGSSCRWRARLWRACCLFPACAGSLKPCAPPAAAAPWRRRASSSESEGGPRKRRRAGSAAAASGDESGDEGSGGEEGSGGSEAGGSGSDSESGASLASGAGVEGCRGLAAAGRAASHCRRKPPTSHAGAPPTSRLARCPGCHLPPRLFTPVFPIASPPPTLIPKPRSLPASAAEDLEGEIEDVELSAGAAAAVAGRCGAARAAQPAGGTPASPVRCQAGWAACLGA